MTPELHATERPVLAIVVPCHNEQEVLGETVATLLARLDALQADRLVGGDSHVCLVDDGSTDRTWRLICELHAVEPRVRGLKLTRRFGHQGAVLAGMLECTADIVVSIDADLQDDESRIASMVRLYREGHDIVLGVRDDRSSDTFVKRASASLYYRLLRRLGVSVHFNHADYRLLSARAIAELRRYPEANLFLRGIVPMLGLPTAIVTYTRRARSGGRSKYPTRRMLSLGWEGVTSFSVAPLRMVSTVGLLIALAALGVTAWALFVKFHGNTAVPGWASTVVPMYFLGGVQILCLGVIGEYVGKIYIESKHRPRYAVEEHLGSAPGHGARETMRR